MLLYFFLRNKKLNSSSSRSSFQKLIFNLTGRCLTTIRWVGSKLTAVVNESVNAGVNGCL